MTWRVVFTAQARRDARKVQAAGLQADVQALLDLLVRDPCATPPRFEKLRGDLAGAISRRITIQHRLVYQVLEQERAVKVLRMWTHYE